MTDSSHRLNHLRHQYSAASLRDYSLTSALQSMESNDPLSLHNPQSFWSEGFFEDAVNDSFDIFSSRNNRGGTGGPGQGFFRSGIWGIRSDWGAIGIGLDNLTDHLSNSHGHGKKRKEKYKISMSHPTKMEKGFVKDVIPPPGEFQFDYSKSVRNGNQT
jgi:hypothetical protein